MEQGPHVAQAVAKNAGPGMPHGARTLEQVSGTGKVAGPDGGLRAQKQDLLFLLPPAGLAQPQRERQAARSDLTRGKARDLREEGHLPREQRPGRSVLSGRETL